LEVVDIIATKEKFIIKYPSYKADVENFINFVQTKYNLNPKNINGWFCSIDADKVKECLNALCDNGTFKTKSKAKNFINALSKFFYYLLDEGLSNDYLYKELKGTLGTDNTRTTYHSQLMAYIEDTRTLKDKRTFFPITSEEADTLIDHCDKLIDKRILFVKGSEPKIFGQMTSALCVKLILFTGISYNVARLLEFNDLKPNYGLIEINGINLMLPPKLSHQFKEYARIYKEKGINKITSKLFIGKDGAPWGDRTPDSGIVTVLKAAIDKYSISEINRGSIQQHIINGMPERTITKLTGEKDDVLSKCYGDVFSNDYDLFSLVNSTIVKNPIYSKL